MDSTSSQLISPKDWFDGIIDVINSILSIRLTAEQEREALALILVAWANRYRAIKNRNRTPWPNRREIERSLPNLKKAKVLIHEHLLELNQDGERELSDAATDAVFSALFRSDTEKNLVLFFDHDRGFPNFAKSVADTLFVLSATIKHCEEILARNYHEPSKIRGMHASQVYVNDLIGVWEDINENIFGAAKIGNGKSVQAISFLRFAEAVEQQVDGFFPEYEKAGGRLLKPETIAEYARKIRNRARS